jgi:hypothetical protein
LAMSLTACPGSGTGIRTCEVTVEGSAGEPRAEYNPEATFAPGDVYRTDGPCAPGDVDQGVA